MSEPFVHIANLNVKYQHKSVLEDLSWVIEHGDNWLLCGESGSGKTTLVKAIAGLIPVFNKEVRLNFKDKGCLVPKVYYVANWYQFKDLEGGANFYYQQRYNSQATATTATVRFELEHFAAENQLRWEDVVSILRILDLTNLIDSTLIQLSSGEHKKLQLIKGIWLKPQLLILDQPYNGLDSQSRQNLNRLLDELTAAGTQLILVGNELDLPTCITRFAQIQDGQLEEISLAHLQVENPMVLTKNIPTFLNVQDPVFEPQEIIRMVDVNISYTGKQVLKEISWEVKSGEKWLIQGHNGSGKSTLLSLICGDHPQAYANNFYLFGQKRGSGESIWDIKKRIGLISPELHWYFDASATVWQTVTSGFFDSAGLFCNPGSSKYAQVDELLDYFDLRADKDRLMNILPLGKQRLALLARTIIKNPELLILDEPCQGLDRQQTLHFNSMVDELCGSGKTLLYVGHFESALPDCLDKRILLEDGAVKCIEKRLQKI